MRRLLTDIFGSEPDFQVEAARDGDEAIAMLGSEPGVPNVVLTDLVMPGMSGRELGDRLAADSPELPVMFTSAYSANEVVRRGLLVPGSSYLQKPFTVEELATAVQKLMRQTRD